MGQLRSILYQNETQTITLIDIPNSIAEAQGAVENQPLRQLLSCTPLQQPYQSTEPKSSKARTSLIEKNSTDQTSSSLYISLIESALQEIRTHHDGLWCQPRKVIPGNTSKKRKVGGLIDTYLEEVECLVGPDAHLIPRPVPVRNSSTLSLHPDPLPPSASKGDSYLNTEELVSRLLKLIADNRHSLVTAYLTNTSSGSPTDANRRPDPEKLMQWDGTYYDSYGYPACMMLGEESQKPISMTTNDLESTAEPLYKFYIPPSSTFILSDCYQATKFRDTLRYMSQTHDTKRHFDFILLDPPWPNASVRRKGVYTTGNKLRETKALILGMDLDQYIAPSGVVGIWITNNSAVRSLVLGPGGLFEYLNVGLVEEWIWIKTTINGEPVTALDGLWRKPYEILLLGKAPESRLDDIMPPSDITRRILVGAPDMHSRKPCLKGLIEPYLPERYQALEIFGRYLVSGWWSWGNEVLKYNWDHYWTNC